VLTQLKPRRFFIQLLILFLIFTFGAVLGIGIPAMLLVNRQTKTQLRELMDQSSLTTSALLENKATQLQNLADLIAERPTLNQYLQQEQVAAVIEPYLGDFLKNANVDLILVCDSDSSLAMVGHDNGREICQPDLADGMINVDEKLLWLASASLDSSKLAHIHVVVALSMVSVFKEFQPQTGLDYFLFNRDTLVASNIDVIEDSDARQFNTTLETYEELTLVAEDGLKTRTMAAKIPFMEDQDYRLISYLDIQATSAFNRQLIQIFLITLLLVSLVGSLIAVTVARRISGPINQLAQSAASLQKGLLDVPITSASSIWEIDQLSNALEDARISLMHSLDQLRMEKAWIENLMNSIEEGLLTIDDRGRITYVSDAIEKLLHSDALTLLGQPLDEFFLTPEGEEPFSQQVPTTNQTRRIAVVSNDHEDLLSVSTSTLIPPEAGNATRALLIRNVTDEARIHRLLGEFMANITHEFRTPLAALSASVELLVDQLPTLTKKEIGVLLLALDIGIVNLQALIDNLIEAASIEAGRFKVNPQAIALETILSDALNTIRPIVEKQGLQIIQPNAKLSFQVMADHRRTNQVLINLLSNAIKHSPKGGKINLRTFILGKTVMVEVQDEGKGIPIGEESALFRRFYIPKGADESSQLGLGLSVVKAIIEAQGGEVGCRNNPIGGAIFWFTLPIVTGDTHEGLNC
jgi:signal transduction histidine kinase